MSGQRDFIQGSEIPVELEETIETGHSPVHPNRGDGGLESCGSMPVGDLPGEEVPSPPTQAEQPVCVSPSAQSLPSPDMVTFMQQSFQKMFWDNMRLFQEQQERQQTHRGAQKRPIHDDVDVELRPSSNKVTKLPGKSCAFKSVQAQGEGSGPLGRTSEPQASGGSERTRAHIAPSQSTKACSKSQSQSAPSRKSGSVAESAKPSSQLGANSRSGSSAVRGHSRERERRLSQFGSRSASATAASRVMAIGRDAHTRKHSTPQAHSRRNAGSLYSAPPSPGSPSPSHMGSESGWFCPQSGSDVSPRAGVPIDPSRANSLADVDSVSQVSSSPRTQSWIEDQNSRPADLLETASQKSRQSEPSSRTPDKQDEDRKSESTMAFILTKCAEIFPVQTVTENKEETPDSSQGHWASISTKQAPQAETFFQRSKLVDSKVYQEFSRQTKDRCNQAQAPKGLKLKPTRDSFLRFNHDDGRPSSTAEPNLPQPLLTRVVPKREVTPAFKTMKLYEELARRSLTALSQLDAITNLIGAAMTETAEDKQDKKWANTADPNLLIELLEGQHQTISHLSQLSAFLLTNTLMDRRQATLVGSSIPQEIQRSLLRSDPLSKGLWEEKVLEKATRDLEQDALTRPFRKPYPSYSKQRPFQSQHRAGSGDTQRKTSDPSLYKSSQKFPSSAKQGHSQAPSFGATAFGNNSGTSSFPKGNFQRRRVLHKRK